MTPRETLGSGCVHIAQLMTHQLFQHLFILQLCYKPVGITYLITKSKKVYISCHDGLENFITPTFLNIGPMVFQSEDRVAEISFFLQ